MLKNSFLCGGVNECFLFRKEQLFKESLNGPDISEENELNILIQIILIILGSQ